MLASERGALYELVPEGKALYADFSLELLPEGGIGYAAAAFPGGGDPKSLEGDVRAILARIAKDGVPADLVAAAKLQERREAEFAKNSIEGLATVWSEAVAVYGLDSPDEDLERIEKVTVADVNRVARKYLDLDHAVVAVLTPQGADKPVASKGFGGKESIALAPGQADQAARLGGGGAREAAVPKSTVQPTVSVLPNGITLIVQPADVSDTVSVYGRIRTRPELTVPPGQEGMSPVMDQLFGYGTEHLDRVAFQQALDAIGAEAQAGTSFEMRALTRAFRARRRAAWPTTSCTRRFRPRPSPWSSARSPKPSPASSRARAIRRRTRCARRCSRRAIRPCARRRPRPSARITLDQVRAYYDKDLPARPHDDRRHRQGHARGSARDDREIFRRLEGLGTEARDRSADGAAERAERRRRARCEPRAGPGDARPDARPHALEPRLLRARARQQRARRQLLFDAPDPRSAQGDGPRLYHRRVARSRQDAELLSGRLCLRPAERVEGAERGRARARGNAERAGHAGRAAPRQGAAAAPDPARRIERAGDRRRPARARRRSSCRSTSRPWPPTAIWH